MSGTPYPKASQLARGERRYRRKVASPKQRNLTDAEYAYVVGKLGEGGMERLFGVSGR